MTPFVTAGAGFLLAVLWFDLMFDLQTRRHRGGPVPEETLASIAAYYRRVTTTARPMNRLVGLIMVGTIAAIGFQIAGDDAPGWLGWASLPLVAVPVSIAATRTFPHAVRLARRADAPDTQARLAHGIRRDHLFCLACIASVLVIQLGWAR